MHYSNVLMLGVRAGNEESTRAVRAVLVDVLNGDDPRPALLCNLIELSRCQPNPVIEQAIQQLSDCVADSSLVKQFMET